MSSLKNKVMIITGASRGLGKFLCYYFAKKGVKIVAVARSEDKLKELQAEIKNENGVIKIFPLDVRDFKGIGLLVDEVLKDFNKIDILINNAGVGKNANFEDLSQQDIDNMIDTNLKGTIYFTRQIVPVMIRRKKGYIINISSTSSIRGLNNNGIYHASKFGVNGFSDAMSKYLMKNNIYVTTLCPGGIETTLYDIGEWGDYLWGRENLIKPEEVAKFIDLIFELRPTTLFKNAVFFPTCEAEYW
ncbi:MAG: SDR family NAD(P)-dependent oxidoreductase [Candidatus Humimicrobiaceae bacterium]